MIGFGIAYIVCSILYTIACVMDGGDVKPQWKKWVGRRLEKTANYFHPIKYVVDTRYIPLPQPTPFERIEYDVTRYDSRKITSVAFINECDIMDEYIRSPYERKVLMERIIAARKRDCLRSIFDKIATDNVVSFEVKNDQLRHRIVVSARLYVEKKG